MKKLIVLVGVLSRSLHATPLHFKQPPTHSFGSAWPLIIITVIALCAVVLYLFKRHIHAGKNRGELHLIEQQCLNHNLSASVIKYRSMHLLIIDNGQHIVVKPIEMNQ